MKKPAKKQKASPKKLAVANAKRLRGGFSTVPVEGPGGSIIGVDNHIQG